MSEQEPRHVTLLRAALHILRECDAGPYVKNALEVTAIWDDAECDGMCLMDEIGEWLEENGFARGVTISEQKACNDLRRAGLRSDD